MLPKIVCFTEISFKVFVQLQVFFHSLDITKAEVYDVHFLKNINQQMSDCMLHVDRGYLSESNQLDLFHSVNIKMETPKRMNQVKYKPQPYISENPEKE